MKTRRWPGHFLAGLGLSALALSGCQTWTSGMTLPSGRYLEHPPQYFRPSPPFPLSRELASQEAAAAAAAGAAPGAAAPLPTPVPPAEPAPAPVPPPAPPPAGAGGAPAPLAPPPG
jgi:hypothetical protein